MPVFDAIFPTEGESVAAVQPRLFGRRPADLDATAGGAVWVALASPVGSPGAVVIITFPGDELRVVKPCSPSS